MEQSIGLRIPDSPRTEEQAYTGLWKLRLELAGVILLAALVGLFALSWDIQWHTAVGRDRTLTMPHLFILGSITVMGLAGLVAVLSETTWARRNPTIAQNGTAFAGIFSSSLGAYLVGYGALAAAIAFPIDQYWHTLYGIDVSIWAPFHIMAITGFCMCCLGLAEIFASGARLAAQQKAKNAARAGYIGMAITLAILLGLLTILLPNALGIGFIILGNIAFTVFPLLLAIFGMFVFVIAARALPWRAPATSVAVIYLFFGLLNFLLIPPLMSWLLGIEQQGLRPRAPTVSVLAVEWQYGFILAALILDIVLWIGKRRGWSLPKIDRATLISGMIGMCLTALSFPSFSSVAIAYGTYGVRVAKAGTVISTAPHASALLVLLLSLLLGLLGTYIGYWLGTGIAVSMQEKDQAEYA